MTKKEKQRRRAVGKQRRREAKARTALKDEALNLPEVIQLPNNTAEKEQQTMGKKDTNKGTDQATDDLTINTQAAPDFGGNPPPVDNYEGPDSADDLLPPEDPDPLQNSTTGLPVVEEEIPNEIVTDEGKQRSPTNEELCATAIEAAKKAEEETPAEQQISEFSLKFIRDAEWYRNVVTFWFLFWGSFGYEFNVLRTKFRNWRIEVGTKIMNWSTAQTTKLGNSWNQAFPPKASRDDLLALARVLADTFSDVHTNYNKHVDVLTARVNALQNAIEGKAPRTVPADKLIALLKAYKGGESVKTTALFAKLSGLQLGEAKDQLEALKPVPA